MKKANGLILGLVLIALGVIWGLNAMGIAQIDLFFNGWWTLFIIVPCAVGLFTEREKTGNLVGIGLGVVLLLCCWEILSFSLVWKILLPAAVVIVGVKILLTVLRGNRAEEILKGLHSQGKRPRLGCAIFSGCDLNYCGEVFEGAELTAVFGGVECDLRHAVIEKDCAIRAFAIFGGVDLLVPENVNVRVRSVGIFGGSSNKTPLRKGLPTLYVSSTCVFGGLEIK